MREKGTYEKAEMAIDGDEDDLVLCLLTIEIKKENLKKKIQFVEDIEHPTEACMMCTINGDTFSFTKNTQIRDSGASCHITNDDTILFDITIIIKLIQGSSRNMLATKKCKLYINI